MKLAGNRYGKSRVRVARVIRHKNRHQFYEMTVGIRLEGDFEASYRVGDNRLVLPTDTMKNTVYALASDDSIADPDRWALLLARHFLREQPHIAKARIDIQSHLWQRHGKFSFLPGGSHRRLARADVSREAETTQAGVAGYVLLKTAGSGFEGYIKDRYTTLAETSDRILATSLTALWRGEALWDEVIEALTNTFAAHESKSVQHTLYAMGEAVFAQFPAISRIRMRMPNVHYLPVDLSRFGLEDRNEVFCPTNEPHGVIEAVLERGRRIGF